MWLTLGLGWSIACFVLWYTLVPRRVAFTRVPSVYDMPRDDVPVYMRAKSQGYEPYYNTTGLNGAVSSELDICSNVGVYLLSKGGSAADAAIGTASCIGAVDLFHSGIGGGGFALVKTQGNDPVVLDYREKAPRAAHRDMFVGLPQNASLYGGLAVAVPGEVRGWEQLHKMYGRLPWSELLEPVITITRHGFKIPTQLYDRLDTAKDILCNTPRLGRVYCPDGRLVQAGEHIRLEALSRAYEQIALYGPNAFYQGDIAKRTVAAVREAGGIMTMDDLRDFRVLIREARSITYRDQYRVWSSPMPSSGSVVLAALKTMEHFADEPYAPEHVLHTHRLIEATKYAYGERGQLGDPAFVPHGPAMEDHMVSDARAAWRRRNIRDAHVQPIDAYDPQHLYMAEDRGTSHFNVIDAQGMSIASTTTINGIWGSGVLTEDGILLNNDMDDFASPGRSNQFGYAPAEANFIEPGKRPLSSMSPLMVENLRTGDLELLMGSAGGSRIITANIQLVYAFLSHHGQKRIDHFIAQPRWHDQLLPPITMFEYAVPATMIPNFVGYNNATVAELAAKGHEPVYYAPGLSNAQAIQCMHRDGRTDGQPWLFAATEIRQREARGAAI